MSAGALAQAGVTLTTTVERIVETGGAADAGAVAINEAVTEPLTAVYSGDVLRYTITFENTSTQQVAPGSVVITNPLPDGTLYLDGSAQGRATTVSYSVDGVTFAAPSELLVGEGQGARAASATDYRAIRWAYGRGWAPGEISTVSFDLQMP
ncbi:MAG: hypothetical protein AAGE43_05980 [Pseudomonadota bacterium]